MAEKGKKHKCEFSPPSPDVSPFLVNKIEKIVDEKLLAWEEKFNKTLDTHFEETKKSWKQNTLELKQDLKTMFAEYTLKLNDQSAEIQQVKRQLNLETERNNRLEANLKKKNLRFLRISEEITTDNLSQHVIESLNRCSIAVVNTDIDTVYRLPQKHNKQSRPVLVTFNSLAIRNHVWNNKHKLHSSNLTIQEDLPAEWAKHRKELWPILKQARNLNSTDNPVKSRYKWGGIEINGKFYNQHNLEELPTLLNPGEVWTPTKEKVVLFFTKNSPLSNHYLSTFTFENVTYNCGEQFIMCTKAKLFGDLESVKAIMAEKNPKLQKKLGKKVANFKLETWHNQICELIQPGIQAKFEQNKHALETLKNTGQKRIAEANPYDHVFGIGMAFDHPDAWEPAKWPTKGNIMGNILENVRKNVIK